MNRSQHCFLVFVTVLLSNSATASADKIVLSEPENDFRTFRVEYVLDVKGTLHLQDERQLPLHLPLKANASLEYEEKRIARSEENVFARSVRYYRKAQAESTVGKKQHQNRFSERKFLVAEIHRVNFRIYDFQKPLSIPDSELLKIQADSLGIHRLLPLKKVEKGDSWTLTTDAVVILTGMDNVIESKITCRLESVETAKTRIAFTGHAKGILDGASTEIELTGHFSFDIKNRCIDKLEMKFTQKTKEGPVAPPSQTETKLVMKRIPLEHDSSLTESVLAAIPKTSSPAMLALRFDFPSVVAFHCDRNWKIFHASNEYAILRLIENGQFLAQCKIAPLQKQAVGRHLSEKQFQKDIAAALGSRLKSIDKAEELETKGGRFLYRVTVSGQLGKQPMRWLYYLCASPQGHQVAVVFSMDRTAEKQFGHRDISIVKSLQFHSKTRSASNIRN